MSALRAALASARSGLRVRRRRLLLTSLGIALASAMLSAAVVVSYGLGTGFDRSARAAGLPDVIARFDDEPVRTIESRISALPDVARYSLRLEFTNASIGAGGRRRGDAVAEVVDPGLHHGYAVVAGHDLGLRGSQVLVELGFARAWGLRVGGSMYVGDLGPQRIVGFAESPDDVGYPLAKPRFYLSRPALDARFGRDPNEHANLAEIWLRDPRYVPEVLVQARATSFGLRDIRFATRSGVRALLDQAAGIVIDLLVALSLIALVTAGAMLAASARAEVQRRLAAIGVRRAVGEARGQVALSIGVEAALVAVPAASLGVLVGLLATYSPASRLLTMLNEPAPGWALWWPLALAWLAGFGLPVLGAAWPAWRAARGPVVGLLRGADVVAGRRGLVRWSGLAGLGARMAGARRVRLLATVATLGLSAGFVLLLLALASALSTLETDPTALGKRYQLTAVPSGASEVRRIPGVEGVSPRYEVQAADSFDLGETIDVVAYPGDHTRFEAPALVSGRRLHGLGEAEVGDGLAQALGLEPGSVLAIALPSGAELRLRVVGVVSSLQHDGRVAYVPAAALLRADPSAPSTLSVLVSGDVGAVTRALVAIGAAPSVPLGATARGAQLVAVLRTLLLVVAVVDGLVCLYALIQACGLTVLERRRTVAVLQACGGGANAVRRLLFGSVLALVVPAGVVGVLLERFVFGPALSSLAVNYATLDLVAGVLQVAAVVVGLVAAGVVAVVFVAREAVRGPVVAGLSA